MNHYDLSRRFWNWAFENPDKIQPTHAAMYFFALDKHNRLGQKDKFGFPTESTMEVLNIARYETYKKYFNDLCAWGFFTLIQKSQNQYTSSVISLSTATLKNSKALDRAIVNQIVKHTAEQSQSTPQSDSSIDKQQTTNNKSTDDGSELVFYKFKSTQVVDAWREWIKFKTEKGQTYKSVGIKKAIAKLFNISKGDCAYAIDMLDEAMSNNYTGFFKIKNREPIIGFREPVSKPTKDYSHLCGWDRQVQEHFDKAEGADAEYQKRHRDFRESYYPDCDKYALHLKFPEFLDAEGRFIYPERRPKCL